MPQSRKYKSSEQYNKIENRVFRRRAKPEECVETLLRTRQNMFGITLFLLLSVCDSPKYVVISNGITNEAAGTIIAFIYIALRGNVKNNSGQ